MRKLTVKNFSVIKEAELEFGKITVLIGPQSSGKSLLCKLAYFMERVTLEIAIVQVVKLNGFSEFNAAVQREFTKWFPQSGWGDKNWSLEFQSNLFKVSISESATSEMSSEAKFEFSEEFKIEYSSRLKETLDDRQIRGGFLLAQALQSLAATKFMRLAGRGVWDAATYIPLERSYFVDTQTGYRALAGELDQISSRFAVVYADSLNRDVPKTRVSLFLNGDLQYLPDGPAFSFRDGRLLPLHYLSSGSKQMLPIIAVLDMYEYRRRNSFPALPTQELYGDKLYVFDDITIEEPEASVFPETQYDLVKEITALSNEIGFAPHFTITTHSPYILSVFGDLVKAGKVGTESSEHHAAVAKVVPEKYWIRDGDFAAYKIENGKLESIFDEKTGQIDGDYLDNVSGKISDELGQLLEIQYGK
jgi:hypothetical protein